MKMKTEAKVMNINLMRIFHMCAFVNDCVVP
jgi:hypothetical protein